ncbi:threonine--tRNA ligase [candidate division WWE3 bacterium]|nr:threonine--tRNA ligase [candidate division WWE3 bacterium]
MKSKQQKNNKQNLEALRHTAEHVLHTAMQNLYPNLKKVMGPPIETGFYFDFDLEGQNISSEDFPKIEAEMQKIIDADLPITKREVSAKEAKEIFADNPYKLETIAKIEDEGAKITFYEFGSKDSKYHDTDLCKGPHVESTGEVKAFKLLSVAGAYYKGDENNKMLQRIYGTAFPSKEQLQKHLDYLEEAKKRDHRKLGQQLDLFTFSPLVGPGLPLFTPKGTIIKEELQKHIEKVCRNYGFQKILTPPLAKIKLYKLSGHAKKFSEELFHVTSARNHEFVMRPVQCPHQTQVFASRMRSYRDLPIRYMESEKQYRAEKGGEVGGLNRVYAINIEDGHSFCRVDQVKDEVKGMINIIKDFYSALGLWGNHWISLSVRDYDHPEKYIGSTEDWDVCEQMLTDVNEEMNLEAKRCEGEAALYGPKIDVMFKDALGKEVQIPTVQVDFATPKRFDLYYINKAGNKVPPVMVHRAILGSYERMIALLIEHFAGAFPVWLAPVQVQIIPVSEKNNSYAQKVASTLKKNEIRVEMDDSDNTMQAKIRDAQMQKVPYMLILGDREEKAETVSVRLRTEENKGALPLEEFVEKVKDKYLTKDLELW